MMPFFTHSRNGDVVERQSELAQEDLAGQRLAEGREEVDVPVGGERVDQRLRQVPDDRFEAGDLLGGEQRVEQLAVLGVLLAVEHQRDQRPAGTQRHRHDRGCVRIDRVDVAALRHRDHVVEARELHGVVALGERRAIVDGGDTLVGVDDAVDEGGGDAVPPALPSSVIATPSGASVDLPDVARE